MRKLSILLLIPLIFKQETLQGAFLSPFAYLCISGGAVTSGAAFVGYRYYRYLRDWEKRFNQLEAKVDAGFTEITKKQLPEIKTLINTRCSRLETLFTEETQGLRIIIGALQTEMSQGFIAVESNAQHRHNEHIAIMRGLFQESQRAGHIIRRTDAPSKK